MKQTSRTRPVKRLTAQQIADNAARRAKVARFQLTLGYVIIAVVVVLAFVQSFAPGLVHAQRGNPAIAVGLAALAVIRLLFLKRELKRQAATDLVEAGARTIANGKGRTSARSAH